MKNQQLRQLISKRCREEINKKKNKMQYIGVVAPYGYSINLEEHKLYIDKNCSHVVFTIFDLYDKGYGFTTIADYLNERGIVTPTDYRKTGEYISSKKNNSSLKWEKSSIRKIITNKVYQGSYLYTAENTHEAIIDNNLWNSVQSRLEGKSTHSGHDFYDKNGNEFCGKVFCSVCNKPFTIENSRCKNGIVQYLRCSSYDCRGKHKCKCDNKLAIRYDELRDIVDFFIDKHLFNNVNISSLKDNFIDLTKDNNIKIKRFYLRQEKQVLNKLLNKYQTLLNDIIDDSILYNKILKEEYNDKISSINDRIKEIDTMIKELYSLGRIRIIHDNDLFLDKFIIEKFVKKIEIGILKNDSRNIEIFLN